MFESVFKVLKKLEPLCLLPGDFLRLLEVLKVFLVCSYIDCMLSTKEEGSSTFESIDNSGEFFVVGVVVSFSWEEAS